MDSITQTKNQYRLEEWQAASVVLAGTASNNAAKE